MYQFMHVGGGWHGIFNHVQFYLISPRNRLHCIMNLTLWFYVMLYVKVFISYDCSQLRMLIVIIYYDLAFVTAQMLTHWGRVTHICVGKLTIIDSDNGLSPGRRQSIIWTNAGILLIRPLGTNFNEMLVEILTFSFMKMCLKVSSAKWRSCCLGLSVCMTA